jgi:hypothetical protein
VALYHALAMASSAGFLRGLVITGGAALAAALGVAGLLPARAQASDTEQSILMDDKQLIYASTTHVEQAMEHIAALGVDRIKVSVVWSLVAPDASSTHKPNFDATDPNAYPNGAWKRYDLVVQLAKQIGLGVYFQLTAPAPVWATGHRAENPGHTWSENPNPREFGQFAEAVGRRYSGTFVPPQGTSTAVPIVSVPLGPTTIAVNNPGAAQTPSKPGALPAVTWWGIWNEPNEVSWLTPQTRVYAGRRVSYSPVLDRALTDDGYAGLRASGHAGDTILIGETASGGTVRPNAFVRDLYCVGSRYRPLRGSAAAALRCPASGSRAAFVAAHPALFRAAGYAHHPYSFDHRPNAIFAKQPSIVTLANLGAFEHGLDRALAAYGQPTGMPIYATEWGYKTNPPNPFVKTSLAQQALWLNEGEYMSWQDPRIRALCQFLLYDDVPRQGAVPGTLSYWSTFQSGLYYSGGRAKPSLAAFEIPIWLPSARHGSRVTVWGELRPAPRGTLQYGVIEYRPAGASSWSTLRELQTSNPEGFILAHVAIPGRGSIRLDWLNPATGGVDYSRTVTIS